MISPQTLVLYRDDKKQFPHDSTVDQFFEPERFEAYRQLGEHIGDAAWREFWKAEQPQPGKESADSTINLWSWVVGKTQPVPGDSSRWSPTMENAIDELRSAAPGRREETIAWLADHAAEFPSEFRDRAIALERAFDVESEEWNRLLIDKAMVELGPGRQAVRRFFKKRSARGKS